MPCMGGGSGVLATMALDKVSEEISSLIKEIETDLNARNEDVGVMKNSLQRIYSGNTTTVKEPLRKASE